MPLEIPSDDNTDVIYVGLEPATQKLAEGILAIYEASESGSPEIVVVLDTPDEILKATKRGDLSFAVLLGQWTDSALFSTPIAGENLSVIVPEDSEIAELSTQDLASIFRGTITSWSQIDGTDKMIRVIAPSQGSSVRRAILDLLMPVENFSASSLIAFSDQQAIQLVSQASGSIGIVRSSSVTSDVRSLAIYDNGPDEIAGSHQPYLLTQSVYFVAAQEPQGESRQILDWVLSLAGKNAIKAYMNDPRS